MLTGKPYSALTVDIWSCGIVLYAILCGTLPFEDSNTAQLYAKIRNGSYSTPNYLSENAKSLLKGILNTDPYDRFTLEQIQAHPWYNTAFIQSPEAVLGINLIRDKINCMIVEEITKYGIQKDDIIESIINSKHNYFTTLYSLLQKKKTKVIAQNQSRRHKFNALIKIRERISNAPRHTNTLNTTAHYTDKIKKQPYSPKKKYITYGNNTLGRNGRRNTEILLNATGIYVRRATQTHDVRDLQIKAHSITPCTNSTRKCSLPMALIYKNAYKIRKQAKTNDTLTEAKEKYSSSRNNTSYLGNITNAYASKNYLNNTMRMDSILRRTSVGRGPYKLRK